MLELTRRIEEKILIDNGQIEINVLNVRNRHVTFGINAPAERGLPHLFRLRIGEQILIDNDQIRIKVIYIFNGIVGLGINAPALMDIDRKELFIKKQLDKQKLLGSL